MLHVIVSLNVLLLSTPFRRIKNLIRDIKGASLPQTVVEGGILYELREIPHDVNEKDGDIFTEDNNDYFPGRLLVADKNLADGNPIPVAGLGTGKVDVSLDIDTGGNKFVVEDVPITFGKIQEAVQTLVRQMYNSNGYRQPARIKSITGDYTSKEEIAIKAGCDLKFAAQFSGSVSTNQSHTTITHLDDLSQVYYNVVVTPADNDYSNLFGPEVTVDDIYFQTRMDTKSDFLKYSGSVDPTDVGSFGNTFQYKNLRLNVFLTYSFGNVIRLDPVFDDEYNDLDSMPKEFKNRWVVPGDEEFTTIPVIASYMQNRWYRLNSDGLSYAYNAYNYSTERIAKGDFIRMKEISLSYDFPKKWLNPIKLNALSLKLQATNLFLLYADKKLNGQDPEFFNTGGVAVPVPKQFTLTLRVGF